MFTDDLRGPDDCGCVLVGLERYEDSAAIRRLAEKGALDEACGLLQEIAFP
jgi:hypothetical protein